MCYPINKKWPGYEPGFGSKYPVTYPSIPFLRNIKPITYMPWYHDLKYLINTLLVGYYFLKNQYPIDSLIGTYHLIGVSYLIFIQNVHPFFHPRTFFHLGFHFFSIYIFNPKPQVVFSRVTGSFASGNVFLLVGTNCRVWLQ
jgi:hypothetical protein